MTLTADTNVFVYLHDDDEPQKRSAARRVVARLIELEISISLQVIGEFQSALTRKLKMPSWSAARESRNLLEAFDTFPPSRAAAERALERAAAGRNSYWDALLLAAAHEAGCTTFLSEDMTDGDLVLGVRIVNPFGSEGELSEAARNVLGLQQ